MSGSLRILHLADTHIGAELPVRPRPGRTYRGDDFIDSYRRVLRLASEHAVDLVVHAGDLFDSPAPSPGAVAAAAGPLLELAAAGVPVVLIPGNHERSAIPSTLLLDHENLHIVRAPCTIALNLRGLRVVVAGLPCIRRQAAARFEDALRQSGWDELRGDVNILAVHQAFESAACGPSSFRFRSGEDVIERDAVPRGFDYVAAGHVHRYQSLAVPAPGVPPVVYAGSPDRITFAERNEPKGAVLATLADGRFQPRFIEHPVRSMTACSVDVTGLSRGHVLDAALSALRDCPSGGIAAIRFSGRATASQMRGLGLARRLRAERPDLLLSVSTQALEFVPEREAARAGSYGETRGDNIDAPRRAQVWRNSEPSVFQLPDELRSVPRGLGTYALFDRAGRLLYIGKARSVRTRLRQHLAGDGRSGNHFGGWTRQIRRVEVRSAGSELEALIVEADAIRRHRPPFNRQMRLWSRYVYLCESGLPHGQLEIRRDAPSERKCFGPYRSRAAAEQIAEAVAEHFGLARCPPADRPLPAAALLLAPAAQLCARYYAGACGGPCAQRIAPGEYQKRIRQRDALLLGASDESLRELEERVARDAELASDGAAAHAAARRAATLRAAFEHGAMLLRAESLIGRTLRLPGGGTSGVVVRFTRDEVVVAPSERAARDAPDAQTVAPGVAATALAGAAASTVLAGASAAAASLGAAAQRLPKHLLDVYWTAARRGATCPLPHARA
ncbi:MAG: metallophosphoesterase [Phycisphaerae bacterium]